MALGDKGNKGLIIIERRPFLKRHSLKFERFLDKAHFLSDNHEMEGL